MNINKLILSLINKSETIEGILKSGDATYRVDRAEIIQDSKSIKGINFYNNEDIVYELMIEDINSLYTTIEYVEQTDEIPYNNRVTLTVNNGQTIDLYIKMNYLSKGFDDKENTDHLYKRMLNGGTN